MPNSKGVSNYQRMIESELERAISTMRAELVNDEEYLKRLNTVERLHGMLDTEKPRPLSKDTMLSVAANIIGIILILSYESTDNIIRSKALGFILRPR